MEKGITRQEIITELTKSPHGDLKQYVPVGSRAAAEAPEFMAHLIAWNRGHGQIRDSKVALPVLALAGKPDAELKDNALAHLATLDPRNLLRALDFAKDQKFGQRQALTRLVHDYLKTREAKWPWWERVAMQHRASLKALYSRYHIKRSATVGAILFGGERGQGVSPYPRGSAFETIANLQNMEPLEAAGHIMEKKIPFLIAVGALGAKAKDPDTVLALIQRMTPTELVTNMKRLERLGVKTNPILRSALEESLVKASSGKTNTLKTSVAAEAVEDEGLKIKLKAVQEKQLEKHGIDGDWLIAADKSGSMHQAIEAASQIAATLARLVTGRVSLVFFDTGPTHFDVTGKTLDEITAMTKRISAGGGTNIGCSLQYAIDCKLPVGGIALISDGGENAGVPFYDRYKHYAKQFDVEPAVYFYKLTGEPDVFSGSMQRANIDVQTFDLRGGIDFYSIPNLVQTMRTNRYSLIDEIMATPLLALDDVLSYRKENLQYA